MTKLQKRMTMIFLILNIVQIFLIGSYVLYVMFNFSENEIKSASNQKLMQYVNNVERKISIIENYSQIISQNETIHRLISNNDWSKLNGDYLNNSVYMDKELSKVFYDIENISGCLLFPKNGGSYSYLSNDINIDKLKKTDWFNKVKNSEGQLVWLGKKEIPTNYSGDKQYFTVGRKIIVISNNEILNLGDLYFFFDIDQFVPMYGSADDNFYVMNTENEVVFSTSDIDFSEISKEKNIVVSNKSDLLGWQFYYYKQMPSIFLNIVSVILVMLLIFVLSLIAVNIVFYYETKRIFKPITGITEAMKEIGNNNFKVSIEADEENELGIICVGINKMSKELEMLFEKTIMIENQKKKEQIKALQYQMNPHFLYNTLASLKMVALKHNVTEIAQNIEALSRLLRNTINKSDEMISIDLEINNIKDYITLQQFRYKYRIDVRFSIDESVKDSKIPNLLIQPIVENAIAHGLTEKLNNCEEAILNISISKADEDILISIYDNGIGIGAEPTVMKTKGNGIGLGNVNDRIKLIYGEKYGLEIKSEPMVYTEVNLRIADIKEWEND